MFCPSCGTQLSDQALFCSNCGHQIPRAKTQPQPQPQPQMQPQPQPQMQPQVQSVQYQQPVAGQPVQPQVQPVQYQQPVAGQPVQVVSYQQPVAGQPVQVITYQQPVPGQPVQYQQAIPGQPVQAVQYQQPVVQPQIQATVAQPQVQAQANTQTQVQPGNVQNDVSEKKAKKKKGAPVALIVILSILLVGALVGLVIFIGTSGVLKSPKKVFAENVVGVAENVNGEMSEAGLIPLDAIFHIGIDDTDKSHTSTRYTSIESDATEAGIELVQSYSYDEASGNTAYDITVNTNGSPIGTGGMYFSGNDFIFVPMNVNSPMVHYEMDAKTSEELKSKGAIERYSLMVMEMSSADSKDWNEVLGNFSQDVLDDIDKKNFSKSSAMYSLLGTERKCNTAEVSVSGEEAVKILNGLNDVLYKGFGGSEEENSGVFKDVIEDYERYGGNLEIGVITYKYKKTPVAMDVNVMLDGKEYTYSVSYFTKKNEKQFIVDSGTPDGKHSFYEESIVSTGIGTYSMTNRCDFGSFNVYIEQKGQMLGNNKNINGTFEITSDKSYNSTVSSLAGDTVTGTITEMAIMGNGTKTTVIEGKKGNIVVTTEMTREALQNDKINPPEFIPGSGTECGTNIEDLKAVMQTSKMSPVKADSSLVHLAQVYYQFIRTSMGR
ncbi:MAG: zinc-ribbon domain-containing protein [Lachnospiraceae bacterium]|nr:zinc-ribbon domain-containing protein [Lachnospiraceae bacterium]